MGGKKEEKLAGKQEERLENRTKPYHGKVQSFLDQNTDLPNFEVYPITLLRTQRLKFVLKMCNTKKYQE